MNMWGFPKLSDYYIREWLHEKNGGCYPYWYHGSTASHERTEKKEPSINYELSILRSRVQSKLAKYQNKLAYNKTKKRRNKWFVRRYAALDSYLAELERLLEVKRQERKKQQNQGEAA